MKGLVGLVLVTGCGLLGCSGTGTVSEERVTEINGVVRECGEGPGLAPCRDPATGETYAEELSPDAYIENESTEELLDSSQRINNESPAQRERTIEELENN